MPMYVYRCSCGEQFEELRHMDERDNPILCPKDDKADRKSITPVCSPDHITKQWVGSTYMCVMQSKVGPGELPGTTEVYTRKTVIGNDSVGRVRVDKMMRNHDMIGDGTGVGRKGKRRRKYY